jgi:hypothetical protein
MLRFKWLALLLLLVQVANGQELFVYSEPASNMPAKSVGLRVTNWYMQQERGLPNSYHMLPEVMLSLSKNLMLHAEGIFSNRDGSFIGEGFGTYAKYRFYSADGLHRHTRFAAFARYSTNNSIIHQQEIATNGHNTGYQLGVVGTKLLHRTALSLTAYGEGLSGARVIDRELVGRLSDYALNYSLSGGRLMLPKAYRGYKQTNVNLMVELLGQYQPQIGGFYVDIAPSVQFIFNSQARLDIGYRKQITTNISRSTPNGLLLRLEYLLFNVL